MPLTLGPEIRDPIHGLIRLTDQEIAIVNTPAFQRLRRIRQLALADLVYPGALHTRFEHSIGVTHIAHRIMARLREVSQDADTHVTDDDWKHVRLAALLHDIGHGPYSHVSESLLEQHTPRDKLPDLSAREKIHERITVDVIERTDDIIAELTADEIEAVVRLIQGSGTRDYRRDVISSELDADKMDYLLRDAYYAGVQYGHYDLDKVIDAFSIARQEPETYAAITEDGLFAVEQLILSKHHMSQQVYGHRVRIITDSMIVRGLNLAIESDEKVRSIYTYDGTKEFLARYLATDDASIAQLVATGGDPRASDVFDRLRNRRLYKQLGVITINERDVPNAIIRSRLLDMSREAAIQIESAVAKKLNCQPWEVIVEHQRVKNPAYVSPGALNPEAILILPRSGSPRRLSDFGELVVAKLPAIDRIHVIGPLDEERDTPSVNRRASRSQLDALVREIVFDVIGGGP